MPLQPRDQRRILDPLPPCERLLRQTAPLVRPHHRLPLRGRRDPPASLITPYSARSASRSLRMGSSITGASSRASAGLNRVLHRAAVINLKGDAKRVRDKRHAGILPGAVVLERAKNGTPTTKPKLARGGADPGWVNSRRARVGRISACVDNQTGRPIRSQLLDSTSFRLNAWGRCLGEFSPTLWSKWQVPRASRRAEQFLWTSSLGIGPTSCTLCSSHLCAGALLHRRSPPARSPSSFRNRQ